MKNEYTHRQLDAAAREYLAEKNRHKTLTLDAEDLLKEGEYVQRERVLRKAELQSRYMDGMRRMAEVMGVGEAAFSRAVKLLEKPSRRPKP